MLRVVLASSPKAKERFFLENKSQEDLWLVSHVEAKRTLQDFFLESQTTIFNKSVLRASEYWQWLFSVNCPDWRAVSESLVFTLIEQWFDEAQVDVRYRNLDMFRNFFGQALPLLLTGDAALLEEWLTVDGQRDERLAGWFQQARSFWEFTSRRKWIGRNWAINVLGQQESLFFGTYRHIYIDLGLDLRQEEVEMILRLAREQDVTVLIPRTPWSERYRSSLDIYKKIIDASQSTEDLPEAHEPPVSQLYHYASVLKESKAAVIEVRRLLDQGVPPHKIAIVSSNIEDYWDMLREHFLVEGVPVQKKYVLRAISLPSVQSWLARLNLARRDFEQAHLETHLYGGGEPLPGAPEYIDFKKNFSQIYDPQDVRDYLKLPPPSEPQTILTLTDFVDFILAEWKSPEREVADEIVDLMAQEIRPSDSLTFGLWLKYLELMISRYELEVRPAEDAGLLLTNFNQADWANVDHAFVLGCEQSRLREISPSPLSGEDIARLELDLGYYLQRPESLKKEFELRWFCEKQLASLSLSHSQSDFDGQPQMAASFWLELEGVQKSSTIEGVTRWDSVMMAPLDKTQKELGLDEAESEIQKRQIARESSLEAYEPVGKREGLSLSAGSLSNYYKCPFVFYADKVLKLRDLNEFDLDIDPLFQGQVWHKVVEDIHRDHADLNLNGEQLSQLYDRAAESLDVKSPLRRFWLQEKARHLIIIQNFIELEKEWRAKFPQIRTVATEAAVKGFIGIEGGRVRLSPEKPNDSFYPFNGRVDRIDQDPQGHLSVVDYKTSSTALKAFKNWPQNGQFQMPLYALALENGLGEGIDAASVMAASYFVFREKKRGLGFIIEEGDHGFADLKEKSAQYVSGETKTAVFEALMNEIQAIFSQLELGMFPPQPRDPDMCGSCNWRRVCRAPHLK